MDIQRAKEEIKRAVQAYLATDDIGRPLIPAVRQRPILLMGPPGVGKTQIMEQIAQECDIALVAYTITHHTRQSAVGLPFIRERNYGGRTRSVTEYTMSEIIASVYAAMERTGKKNGILFIDEINCVSETLAPTMLQFLQCKTFGNQAVPGGWVIVAAGNPPEYNKSVREFDLVTLDRVRRIDIEPKLSVWQDYARAHRLHPAVTAYLELRPQHFYKIENDVDGVQFVTARGWEDLSAYLQAADRLALPVDEGVIGQYLRHPEVARDFAAYWVLYRKYHEDYGVEDILQGKPYDAVIARAMDASFDERISLVSLLLAGLNTRFADARATGAVTDACYQQLRSFKRTLTQQNDADPAALFAAQCENYRARLDTDKAAGALLPDEAAARTRTLALLEAAHEAWNGAWEGKRFHHVSTDEVYGALGFDGTLFTERTRYDPHSPYSASKASSDHFVRAFHDTYGLPTVVTNCSNNYGPYQFPEKLIPLFINNIRHGRPLPVYGKGENVRDWLYVEDHARALDLVFHEGHTGETYNIGGFNEWRNIDLIRVLVRTVDRLLGREEGASDGLITYVTDRAGHDLRYAIDSRKLKDELGWEPSLQFEEGIEKTVKWYLENQAWMDEITSGDYESYYERMYANR